MASYQLISLADSLRALGTRAQRLRLLRNWTQDELAKRAGVGIKALRRFESAGEGTMANAVRVASALGVQEAFEKLFEAPRFNSLAEVEAQEAAVTRRRARSRK